MSETAEQEYQRMMDEQAALDWARANLGDWERDAAKEPTGDEDYQGETA